MAISALKMAGLGALALLALSSVPAFALAHGTLTFDQPTGTALGDENIPVYFSFKLDPTSDALITDESHHIVSGGPSMQQLLDVGVDIGRDYSVIVNVSFSCSGSFTGGQCPGTNVPYDFLFNSAVAPSFISPASLNIAPGQTFSNVLFGTFLPNAGLVTGGEYKFYTAINSTPRI